MSFKIETEITDEQVRGLLCSAFEGGSNHWYVIISYKFSRGLSMDDFVKGGKLQDPMNYWHPSQLVPLQPGCAVILKDMEGDQNKRYDLDRLAIQRGLVLMQQKFPNRWADVISDNADATTGDAFLQLCVFGDIIYS